MKRNAEQLIKEISDFLVVYLKSGKVGLNSFITKTDLKISQLEQLLNLHFLLKEEVKQYVKELPVLIRRFKTSTTVKEETSHGKVHGQIQWQQTIKERMRRNSKDKTIYSVVERTREYAIKENLVLFEVLQVLYDILFEKIDSDYYKKYKWFQEWESLKGIVLFMIKKNVYLSHIQFEQGKVTDRMILDTMKHRNPLYQRSAMILYLYRKIISGQLAEIEVQQLLMETFIYPQEEDVLFELYWIVKIIQRNSVNAEFQLLDGRNRNNLVAEWMVETFVYRVFHDSTGSDRIKFNVSSEEVSIDFHPFINRKLASLRDAEERSRAFFGQGFDTTTYWSGRPDIIVEILDKKTSELKKVVLGEVKYTNRLEYVITGLRELMDYMKFVRDKKGNYLEELKNVEVEGMLFTDVIPTFENCEMDLLIEPTSSENKVRVITIK